MNWINIKEEVPPKTGQYFVCIKLNKEFGQFLVKYLAHYNAEENQWFKYNPFDLGDEIEDEIKDEVASWIKLDTMLIS